MDDSDSDDDAVSHGVSRRGVSTAASGEDPRTISQIKRSRIDLEKRYVFLCPSSLNKHFVVLPQQTKDTALLVFRCARNFVFQDSPDVREARISPRTDTGLTRRKPGASRHHCGLVGANRSNIAAVYRSEFTKEFLQWVLQREKDNCVFWFKPERDLRRLSEFFVDKMDPFTEQQYKPLILDPIWWRTRFSQRIAKHVPNAAPIIAGISEHKKLPASAEIKKDIDIIVLQELIFQSNPTLEPIAKWPHAPSMRFTPRESAGQRLGVPSFGGHAPGQKIFKGYIDQDLRGAPDLMSTGTSCRQDQARIHDWPRKGNERLDDLYLTWANEDMYSARSVSLARTGMFSMSRPSTTPARSSTYKSQIF